MPTAPYIVVVGSDARARAAVVTSLRNAGCEWVESLESITPTPGSLPHILILAGPGLASLCAEARRIELLAEVPLLAAVAPGEEGRSCLEVGADGVLHPDDGAATTAALISGMLRLGAERGHRREVEGVQAALLRIQALMAAHGVAPHILRDVLLVAVEHLGFERASLIAHIEGSASAYVIAATDDPSLSQFTLAIRDYPEVAEAIRTEKPVLIPDVAGSPLMAEVGHDLSSRGVRAIAVFPVIWKGRPLGAVLLRRGAVGVDHLGPVQVGFAQLLGNQLAAQLGDSVVFEHFHDQTRRISRASYEAERRLRTIESLKEHFEASADGVFILDERGCVLFVNGTAEALTGFARDGLLEVPLTELVSPAHHEALEEVITSVLSGDNIEAFDLALRTTGDEPITVSVTTSTVLSRSGAVILSFRDVTKQRHLEIELQHTKDFLENLIDSAVDAIVAADMRGQVILFNKGAERLFGHRAEEVIGRLPVWRLYPDGVPNQVMRMLRSESYGGVGRLEQTRREVLTQVGELVPVNMTAAIVYEHDREIASVGIFSDLRERIRIEQRLLQAQEQLQAQQRQAMVAELAGAAAHELNQPLTSIVGYAQLIQRRLEPGAEHARGIDVILGEADRMAEIVKKIGRITRFESVEYVGDTNIMDLDRSAAASGELPVIEDVDHRDEPTARFSLEDLEEPDEVGDDDSLERDEDERSSDSDGQRHVD